MAELSGKVVAITGASSGIGEATALTLARAGASVALGARRKDRIDALATRIEDGGGTAVAFEVDVTDESAARGFVEAAHERLGRLDTLVNNAGVMLLGPVEQSSSDDWRTMLNVNVLGLLSPASCSRRASRCASSSARCCAPRTWRTGSSTRSPSRRTSRSTKS